VTSAGSVLDVVLFVVAPYAVVLLLCISAIYRSRLGTFTHSSLSAQWLENRDHYWAIAPFHLGIVIVLAGHLLAFLLPRQILLWNARPLRLYMLEAATLSAALLALVGIIMALLGPGTNGTARMVTTMMDWLVGLLLCFQVGTGIYVAVFCSWGSSWFAASMAPYLWSLVKFRPDVSYLAPIPLAVQGHVASVWVLIALFPFSRLAQSLFIPYSCYWHRPQVVRRDKAPGRAQREAARP
jgi:nitrate reductase gamma subunit